MIGDEIEVSALSVTGEKVRLGITAPGDVPVFREEVYISIQAEQATDERHARSEPWTRRSESSRKTLRDRPARP